MACSTVFWAESALAAGRYKLAYWREAGAYENQAPPAGELGHVLAAVHVWDESGQPLAGKPIYTSWDVFLGNTDENGYAQIQLYRPNGYDFQIRDGGHASETTPILSVERPPSYGHYSFEIGFLFKSDAANPGTFDTSHVGTLNAQGQDPCRDLSAPHTRSLAYYSTDPQNYCSDAFELGNWTASHGQTFVANGNRVVAMKAFMAAGLGVHHYWTAQILEGGPNGAPIGPPRSSRLHLDQEYFALLVRWGVNDVQVVPGRTYYLKVTRDEGINVYRVNRNNYDSGHYFENGNAVTGSEMVGMVVCGNFHASGSTGTLAGTVRDEEGATLAQVTVSIPQLDLYTTTDSDGRYELPFVPVGTHRVMASREGYIAALLEGVTILNGAVATRDFSLSVDETSGGGEIYSLRYSLLPFEASPEWTSVFDASWGSAADFSLINAGHLGNGVQAARGGRGSSVRLKTFPLRPDTEYEVSVWMRCPDSESDYWVEAGYRLGAHAAQDFDLNSGAWRLIKRFTDDEENGNGDEWRRYTARFDSGLNSQLSLAVKVGASSGTGPAVLFDHWEVISLDLPSLTSAVSETPTSLRVSFAEPVGLHTATNAANYTLTDGDRQWAVFGVIPLGAESLLLTTEPQVEGVNYTLTVEGVGTPFQPDDLAGINGSLVARVAVPLIALDDATTWRYHDLGGVVPFAWRTLDFDDAAWGFGPGLLGHASGSLPEPIRTPVAVSTNRVTTYFRHVFTLPEGMAGAMLRLRTVVDDGVVFWLNGNDLLHVGLTNRLVAYFLPASRMVDNAMFEGPFDVPATALTVGTNLLAAEVHQAAGDAGDVVFGVSVEALITPEQRRGLDGRLQIQMIGGVPTLHWSAAGTGLERATNLFGPWQVVPDASSPYPVHDLQEAEYYRLQPVIGEE